MTNIGTGMPNAHSKIHPAFPFSSLKIFIVCLSLQSLPRRSANDAARVNFRSPVRARPGAMELDLCEERFPHR
jgi:hypothetical protein